MGGDRDLRLVKVAAFTSGLDRMLISPMLVTIAVELHVSLEQAAAAASSYLLLYGITQPLWGVLSDRLGRVRTMRLALVGAGIAGVASATAPNLIVLAVARGFAGAFVGAVIPAALVYVGDSIPLARRQHELASLMAATAGATSISILAGGGIAAISWRAGFAGMAALALFLAVVLGRVAEPRRIVRTHPLAQVRRFLAHPWAIVVIGIALVEGTVVLGCLTYLAPAVEASGRSPALAGACVAVFGVGNLLASLVIKPLIGRVRSGALMVIGGASLSAGWLAAAMDPDLIGAGVGSALIGAGFAFLHSTLQAWATDVAPDARATTISFFAAALFVGSAAAALVVGPLASEGAYSTVFAIAAAVALPLAVFAGIGRDRYVREAAAA
jgi:predicted MFS family arabinose efflux permease